jgi:hypothetical protein
MADEIPPAPSETEDASKAETIRITLPPKQEQQSVKRETVRINLPGKPGSVPPLGVAPKKESTKLGGAPSETVASEPPAMGKPFVPGPPRPPAAPGLPSAPGAPPPPSGIASKPLGGMTPPKPPALGARPTVPLKPAPGPGAGLGAGPTPAPVPSPLSQKAAAPKKETARITLPPEGGAKPALPKATVKMQQTQPLVNRPAASLTPAAPMTAVPGSGLVAPSGPDGAANVMSIAALVVALISLALVFMAYNATAPQ